MASVTLRTRPVAKKGFALFLDIYNEGERYKEYLKLYVSKDYLKPENKNILKHDKDSWELAKAIQAKRLLIVKEGAAGFIPKLNKQDFIAFYRKQAARKSHSTYDNALTHLLAFHKKETLPFKHITEDYIKDFITYLHEQDLSNSSIRLYIARLNIILNVAVEDKIIQTNPVKLLKRGKGSPIPQKKQKKIEYLKLDELRILQNTPYRSESIKNYFLFACFTGLRESDLLKLKWSDIKDGALTYTQKKQGDSKTHYLPLSKQAIELLKAIRIDQDSTNFKESAFVFAHNNSKRAVLWNLKKWAKKAKLDKNIHMHVGRHTFATLALTHGVSLYTVSKMLGHSSIAITQVYAEIIDEVKQRASELIPLL